MAIKASSKPTRVTDSMIRIARPIILAGVSILLCHSILSAQTVNPRQEVLWYRSPAPIWDHALPVGNGRLGAMIFGGANTGPNNGDLQDAGRNAALIDGSQTFEVTSTFS